MKNIFYILILSLLAVYCRSTHQMQQPNRLATTSNFHQFSDDTLSAADARYVTSEYILGITEFELKEYHKALVHLNNAYLKAPNKSGINYALADTYLQLKDLVNAEYYGKQAVNLEPHNKWYHLKLADIYNKSGNTEGEIEELNAYLKKSPSDVQVLYKLANAQKDENKLLESNKTFDKILTLNGPDAYIHYQKYKNFETLGMRDSVITELEAIQRLDPDNPSTLQTLTDYYLEDHKEHKAKHLLRKALKNNPGSNEPVILLSNVYIKLSQVDSVKSLLAPMIRDTTVQTDRKTELIHYMLSKYNSHPHSESIRQLTEQLIEAFIQTDPGNVDSHTLAASFYIQEDKSAKAIGELETALKLQPDNDSLWQELVHQLYQSGNFEETITKAMEANKHVKNNAFIHFVIGSSYFNLKHSQKAITWLKNAVRLPSNNHFKSIIWGVLGDSYSAIDQWASADSAYESALSADSSNTTVLNNYAYYLSERDENLPKALKMAKQAVTSEPDNTSFLDTLGWIYYKLNDYEKAEEYIQQALENSNPGAEVMEHMGDIMQKKGNMQEAKKWWNKALNKDPKRSYLKDKISNN